MCTPIYGSSGTALKVCFASDHAGFETKNALVAYVSDELHCEVEDCGVFVNDPDDDYPAIVAGGSGQGEAIVANRFEGVRCALYYGDPGNRQVDASGKSLDILSSTREHNDANALSLGLRFLTFDQAKDALARWLAVPFPGEPRHARRIAQIDQVT
jgi:ribose 5-phosphate isomerase B